MLRSPSNPREPSPRCGPARNRRPKETRSAPVMIAAPAQPAASICHSAAPPCWGPLPVPAASGSRGALGSRFSRTCVRGLIRLFACFSIRRLRRRRYFGRCQIDGRRRSLAAAASSGVSVSLAYRPYRVFPRRIGSTPQAGNNANNAYVPAITRPRRQQFDQRGFVRPGSNHNVAGAGEGFGNLRRQAKMPHRKSRTDNAGALCPRHIVFCTATRKMQDGIDFAGF